MKKIIIGVLLCLPHTAYSMLRQGSGTFDGMHGVSEHKSREHRLIEHYNTAQDDEQRDEDLRQLFAARLTSYVQAGNAYANKLATTKMSDIKLTKSEDRSLTTAQVIITEQGCCGTTLTEAHLPIMHKEGGAKIDKVAEFLVNKPRTEYSRFGKLLILTIGASLALPPYWCWSVCKDLPQKSE